MSCQCNKKKKTGSDWLVYLSGDAAVLVDIIQIKGPVEFISDGASQDDGQTYNKVLQQGKKTGTKSEDHNKDKKGTDKTFQYLLHWYYVLCFFSSNPVLLTPTEFHQQSEIILKSNEIYTRCAPRTKLYAAFFQTLRKSIIKLHSIDKEKDSKEDGKRKRENISVSCREWKEALRCVSHLKVDRAIVLCVKGFKQEMRIHTWICKREYKKASYCNCAAVTSMILCNDSLNWQKQKNIRDIKDVDR